MAEPSVPQVRGYQAVKGTSTTDTFVVDPAAPGQIGEPVQAGDWIIAVVLSSAPSTQTRLATPPAGWTTLHAMATIGTGTASVGVFATRRQAGDTDYVFAQSAGTALTVVRTFWGSGGRDVAEWIIGAAGTRENTAPANSLATTAPAVVSTLEQSLIVALAAERTLAAETDAQIQVAGAQKWFFDGAVQGTDTNLVVATLAAPTPGSYGPVTFTYPNAHAKNGFALAVAIPPLPVAVDPEPEPERFSVRTVDAAGQLVPAAIKVQTAEGLQSPLAATVVPAGYPSVAAMLATPGFRVAHRGGSLHLPEMSLYAYGQSVLIGYRALEISLARTSDGVWFGLHDETLDRTSGVTGRVAAQMTWSEVQEYRILAAVPQPYLRWEVLMDLYYSTHVIFVDPKHAMVHRTELLNLMDSMPGTPQERFVAKFYGVVNGFPQEAAARGYAGWGYFYEADVPRLAEMQGRWSILGMDYRAPQSAWDAAKAFGKPVMGHICPDLAAVNSALSKGADGFMVSGVRAVPPA